ncbi:MAG: T9SS type A sorting domain-containing protein [Ferruginibacter sp.]
MKRQILHCIIIVLTLASLYNKATAQNLVASYPLNGNANDISGNGLHGTIIGSPAFVDDRFGNANSAIEFPNYTAHRIEVDDNILLHVPSITIAAWVYIANINGLSSFIDKPLGNATSDSWHLGTLSGNYSSWLSNDPNNTNPLSQVASTIPNLAQWHYVVTTFNNTTKEHRLYIDAILQSTNIFNSTIGYDNSKMYLGVAIENGGLNFPMWGRLDDVQIFDADLSPAQINAAYISGLSFNNPGSGNAVSFTGNQDSYVQLPSLLNGTNIFSTDFWVKTGDNNSNSTYWMKPTLVGNANPSSNDGDFGIVINNGQIGVWSGMCSCGDQELQTTKVINDNAWHHVAAVSNGNDLVLYVDGVQLPGSISVAGGGLQTAARPWAIGKNNSCCSGGSPVNATIDEFRVWDIALTETQIRERMCKKNKPGDALYNNLVAGYSFNENLGATALNAKSLSHASLYNAARITSGAPVGDASAYDFTNATKAAGISDASGESFTATSTAGNPDGMQVYRVDEQPNTMNGVVSIGASDTYFGVFQCGGTSPQYNAVYNYSGNPYVTAGNEPNLALYKRADNAVTSWSNAAATLDVAANTLSVAGQSTEYILGSAGTLPLQLLLFTATKQGENALLQWKTTNEVSTSYFDVERSRDGLQFETIGRVAAVNNAGTNHYLFADNSPAKGINYYRLKQADMDGRYTNSTVTVVVFENTKATLSIYPNPAVNTIHIRYAADQKNVTLSIFDITGRKVFAKEFANQSIPEIDISALVKGVYTLQLNDGSRQLFSKLIKL